MWAMRIMRTSQNIFLVGVLGTLLVLPVLAEAMGGDEFAGDDFEGRVADVVRQFDQGVNADRGFPRVLTVLLGSEYGTPQAEMQWATGESISWGQIAVLSYVRATTGRGFEELALEDAHTNVADFMARMEMSQDIMLNSLENLAGAAVRERNSRIFDQLRSQRRFDTLPDLGAGFGLFQEALDFRQLGPASPTKVHSGTAFTPILDKADGGL
jgi:hypothetical protein